MYNFSYNDIYLIRVLLLIGDKNLVVSGFFYKLFIIINDIY